MPDELDMALTLATGVEVAEAAAERAGDPEVKAAGARLKAAIMEALAGDKTAVDRASREDMDLVIGWYSRESRVASVGASMARNIAVHGQHLVGVFPTEGSREPPFTYTIGNHVKGLPEIINIGVDTREIGGLLNWVGERQRREGKALLGEVRAAGAPCPVRLIDASGTNVREEYTVQAGQFLGTEDYRVTQVIVPDRNGRFPGDEGCDEPWASQIILRTN